MTFLLLATFAFSVFIVFYSYVLFPLLLKAMAIGRSFPTLQETKDVPISILIAAYNEESVIKEKIQSILDSEYNGSAIEILIGSDSSSDRTNEIVSEMMKSESRIKLFAFTERRGKPSVVNDLMEAATHSLVILTDANVFFEKDTISKLVRHFTDDKVGLVGANILNVGMRKDGISIQEKSYIQRENLIKYNEGLVYGTMMGPFGGCYMIRKELYENVPADSLVDDFYISMKILQQKYKCINDLEAICYEDVSNDINEEFRRKARISAGNFQNLSYFRSFLLNPFHAAGFCFISHKLIRWITPLFLFSSLIALFFLAFKSPIFLWLFIGELVLLLSPIVNRLLVKGGIHIKLIRFIAYFSLMNLALVKGYFRYKRGINSGVWNPTKRMVEGK